MEARVLKLQAFQKKEFIDFGFCKVLAESKNSGNSMWAVTLAQWSPYAVHRMSVNAVQGGKTSWRQMLYDLNLHKTVIFGRKSLLDNDYTSLAEAGVSLRVVEDAGHSMAWENPSGLAQAIMAGLKD